MSKDRISYRGVVNQGLVVRSIFEHLCPGKTDGPKEDPVVGAWWVELPEGALRLFPQSGCVQVLARDGSIRRSFPNISTFNTVREPSGPRAVRFYREPGGRPVLTVNQQGQILP